MRDTGIGIAPHEAPHVFDRFFRSDAVRHTSDGTGLGLAIAKEIVELHQGKINLQSQLAQGTEVTVWLPTP